jgi:hypothetical protein
MALNLKTNIKIIQHNVRHWNNNRFAFSNIYQAVDPDIILINSHGNKTTTPIKIQNYDVYLKNHLEDQHNGTAIAIKNNIQYRINENYHSDFLSVTIETTFGQISIGTAYVPFRIGYLHYPDFYSFFKQNIPAYFLGDINARHHFLGHNNANQMGNQLATLIQRKHATHIGPYFPTFITHRSKTTPDIILCNRNTYHNHFSEPGPATPSDHTPVIFKLSTSPIQIPIKERLNFKKADWEKYEHSLGTNPVVHPLEINRDNIDEVTKTWTRKIQEAARESIPITTHRTIPHIKPNHIIRTTCIVHNNLLKNIVAQGTSLTKYQFLIALRGKIHREFAKLKSEQWNELIRRTDAERNAKDFWMSIQRMMGNNSTAQQKHLKDHNNEDVYEDQEKEKLFRNYWKHVFKISQEENADFDPITDTTVTEHQINYNNVTELYESTNLQRLHQQTSPINIEDLKRTIATFKQKAPGEDGITKYHLTHLPDNMLRTFLSIIIAALSIGYFPRPWKTSIMIFIPKPGKSPLQHTNYRPISLLSVPGKTLEKIINRKLMQTITQKQLHNQNQHGFRPGLGTGTATALLYEVIASGRANKLRQNVVLRDISRAFDKVWHAGLIYKLLINQIPDYLIRIIQNYLQNRLAKIRIGDYIGEEFKLESGVPQGGCLSPTLFNFYTHDLPNTDGQNINLVYADDITQIVSYRGSEKMLALITAREIGKVNEFENKWKIKTNQAKFQIIPITRRKTEKIKIGTITHNFETQGKSLGLTITTNGFIQHIQNRIKLAKINLQRIYRFRNLSQANKRKLYHCFVKSVLEYPPVPLHTISIMQKRNLQIVQNRAARYITNTNYTDRLTNEEVNNMADLEPINLSLHRQARNIWTKLDSFITETQKQRIVFNNDEIRLFPSSRQLARGPEPLPVY